MKTVREVLEEMQSSCPGCGDRECSSCEIKEKLIDHAIVELKKILVPDRRRRKFGVTDYTLGKTDGFNECVLLAEKNFEGKE